MDELCRGSQLGVVGNALFQPVLDRLDVMIGGFLDLFDASGILFGEFVHNCLERRLGLCRKSRQLGQTRFGQAKQPGHFDFHPMRHETGFRQGGPEPLRLGGVPAIQWRQGVEISGLLDELHCCSHREKSTSDSTIRAGMEGLTGLGRKVTPQSSESALKRHIVWLSCNTTALSGYPANKAPVCCYTFFACNFRTLP